ncbi:MAG TPA: transglutaminase-like domain-containing protein [Methylomirabilota bacterium]|nr:transglutaminase-like domain-containing protein [Methylomirabilota bacterium]
MLDYYAAHGPITDPGPEAAAFVGLPRDVRALARVVQGLIFHYMADEAILGWRPPKERLAEIDTRTVRGMLARLRALDPRPLSEPRPPERRLLGCCRDFTVLLCAMARQAGIPVRARVGFARYFVPGFHVDHEIVEWWDERERRWRLLDPELSERHVAHYTIGFDPGDVPREQFLVGGRAWQLCRAGQADPETFGLVPQLREPRGLRFVRGHVVQDLAALNKLELLLWDTWGVMREGLDAALPLLDEAAEVTQATDGFADVRRLGATPGLAVGDVVYSLSPAQGPRDVALAEALGR